MLAALRDELVREGAAGPFRVMSVRDAATLLAAFEAERAAQGRRGQPASLGGWHREHAWVYAATVQPVLVAAVEAALGVGCCVWATEFWAKGAGSAMAVPWHQDEAFWPAPDVRTVSAWIALTEASIANGGLALVRGSHRRVWPHAPVDPTLGGLDRGVDPTQLHERDVWRPALAPGEALLFDARTVHSSPANPASRPRVALSVRYTVDPTPWLRAPGQPPAVIVGFGTYDQRPPA